MSHILSNKYIDLVKPISRVTKEQFVTIGYQALCLYCAWSQKKDKSNVCSLDEKNRMVWFNKWTLNIVGVVQLGDELLAIICSKIGS